jgi:hypothetical protein
MKTMNNFIKLLGIGALMLSTLVTLANTTPARKKSDNAQVTEKTIKDYFKFPQVLIPHVNNAVVPDVKSEQKVEVLFTTDVNGTVNFVLAKTGNRELKSEIEKQFRSIHFNKLKSEVVHSVVLNFKTL